MRSRASARRDAQGHITKWYGSTEDIHERKLAESALHDVNAQLEQQVAARTAALQASEARMRTIFATSYQYQGLLSLDGKLMDANATSLRGIEARLEDVLGHYFWDTPWFSRTPGMAEAVRQGVAAAALGQSPRQEIKVLLPGGWRHFDFAMRPVHGPDGAVVAIVPEAIDVTERHYAEEKLRQSQKMEAVGQLTGGVAHDFNNLLQVISANLHLISKHAAGNDKIEPRLASAHDAVRRGAKLSSQLLAFSRRQALEPRVVNVGRFVNGIEDMIRRSIGEAIEVETIVYGGLWNTFVDPAQIENAVLNLAINARDAMNGSGKLIIEVGNAFLDDAYARAHPDLAPGQYVMLAVSDTGVGMTPEVVAQAFEPFFSTKPAGSGTGLGLSMVYGFVKQTGGHVKIYSEVGFGTTIKLYLPRCHQSEDAVDAVVSGPLTGGAETILVVEDDAAVRRATVEMLTELGYHVLTASDADSALTIIESSEPIDLLFTDVVMPGTLKSPELARRARERRPGVAVLFTSGYTQNTIVHDGRLDPGIDLLAKPYTVEALAQRVRLVLGKASPQAPAAPIDAAPVTTRSTQELAVLLVEDDELVRHSTTEMLLALGHTVTQASNAEQAMALLAQAEVDVLVTDIGLPDVSGEVFAAEARLLQPTLRIVFATGNEHIHAGGDDGPVLLRKPYDAVAIAAALNAAVPESRSA
ncbi:MAG: response regulator [Cytophagales bacterium]|nr:response regulator [Rhizobacter sp.]